jgi:hypothetical protein
VGLSVRQLWDRPLTWKLALVLAGVLVGLLTLALLLPERLGKLTSWLLLLGWMILLAKTAENDLRLRAQVDPAATRRWSPGRALLFPWWGRVIAVATAALGGALVATATSTPWIPWFLGLLIVGALVEWIVVLVRR